MSGSIELAKGGAGASSAAALVREARRLARGKTTVSIDWVAVKRRNREQLSRLDRLEAAERKLESKR